jgi:hypothetical protein
MILALPNASPATWTANGEVDVSGRTTLRGAVVKLGSGAPYSGRVATSRSS